MMVKKSGLGCGLDSLLSPTRLKQKNSNNEMTLKQLAVDNIQKGVYQPRLSIDPDTLEELAASIKAEGVLQPVVVRRLASGRYELVAGERRWQAAQMAGLHYLPALVRDLSDRSTAAISLIENIQREDLSVLEQAMGMSRLISAFGLTHQQTADAVGRSRTLVSNLLRLLDLEAETKQLLESKQLDMGHARALLALKGRVQVDTAYNVVNAQLSVRDTEALVKRIFLAASGSEKNKTQTKALEVTRLEHSLGDMLGAKVVIQYNAKGKGKLVIAYNNLDELEGILDHIN